MKKVRLITWLSQHCPGMVMLLFLLCIGIQKTNAQNAASTSKSITSEEHLPGQLQNDPIKQKSPAVSIFNFLKTKAAVTKSTQTVNGTTYRFTGKGDWNLPGNWENSIIPPPALKPGDHVIIDGIGACLLNDTKPFLIPKEGSVEISKGKELYVTIGNNMILRGELVNNGKLTVISGTMLTGFAQQKDVKNAGQFKTTALSKIDDKKILPVEVKKD